MKTGKKMFKKKYKHIKKKKVYMKEKNEVGKKIIVKILSDKKTIVTSFIA